MEQNYSTESRAELGKLRGEIAKSIKKATQNGETIEELADGTAKLNENLREVRGSLEKLSSMITAIPREHAILKGLCFNSIDFREETIASAEEGTFDWIYNEEVDDEMVDDKEADDEQEGGAPDKTNHPHNSDEDSTTSTGAISNPREDETSDNKDDVSHLPHGRPPTPETTAAKEAKARERRRKEHAGEMRVEELRRRAEARDSFTTWLREGTGVFHVSGKAGSGKSTLMKYLCINRRTEEELQTWAGDKKLVFANFFFWKSSDKMQTSLHGLYKSILFKTLVQCPELIPTLFPTLWRQLEDGTQYVDRNSIGPSVTKNAFEILARQKEFPRHRFCFFIDGLDEYEGDSVDHVKLAESLQHWTRSADVKICASSRPYLEYLETLPDSPTCRTHLHQLTRHDIYLFSRQMIEKDRNFKQLEDAYISLVEDIVDMADGVFLWARLVVRSLLAGMLRHDTVQALKKKLHVIPQDINKLYEQLLGSLETHEREQALKMLLLTARNPRGDPLPSFVYAWIDDLENPDFPSTDGKKPESWPSIDEISERVHRQLTGLTKGLLETVPMQKINNHIGFKGKFGVQFFHRTVRDFVLEDTALKDIARKFPHLTSAENYNRFWLAEMILTDHDYHLALWNTCLGMRAGRAILQTKLSLPVLNALSGLLKRGPELQSMINPPEFFRGAVVTYRTIGTTKDLSFVHLAAFCDQDEYVFQEISRAPPLVHGDSRMNILLSASAGGRAKLVRALLEKGCSLTTMVTVGLSETTPAYPIWMILLEYFARSLMFYISFQKGHWELMEVLLEHEEVTSTDTFLLLGNEDEKVPTHYITLKQMIEDFNPPNAKRFLVLLEGERGNWYSNITKRLLSGFAVAEKKPESVFTEKTGGLLRIKAGDRSLGLTVLSVYIGSEKMQNKAFHAY